MYLLFQCKQIIKLLLFILPFAVVAEPKIGSITLPINLVQELELKPVLLPTIVVEEEVVKPVLLPTIVIEEEVVTPVPLPSIVVEEIVLKPVDLPDRVIKPIELKPISLLPILGIDKTVLEPVFAPSTGGGKIELKPLVFPILGIDKAEIEPALLPWLDLGIGKIEYEPNNLLKDAKPILPNLTPQAHKFDYAGDEDWLSFYASEGDFYLISVDPDSVGQGVNLAFELYNEAKGVEVELVDSNVTGEGEYVSWEAPTNGFFYIRVINKEKRFNINAHYQVGVAKYFFSQVGLIAGKVIDSCTESGVKAEVKGAGLDASSDTEGGFSVPLIPETSTDGKYQITARKRGYREKSKLVPLEELHLTPVVLDLLPEAGCSVGPAVDDPTVDDPAVDDPALIKQQAVATYDDSTRKLIVKDVRIGDTILAVNLRAQEDFSFIVTTVEQLSEGVSNRPAFYNYDSLLADLPEVFAFGQLYKVKLKRLSAEGAFVIEKAEPLK